MKLRELKELLNRLDDDLTVTLGGVEYDDRPRRMDRNGRVSIELDAVYAPERMERLKEENESLESEISKLSDENGKLDNENIELRCKIGALESARESLEELLNVLKK